MSKLPGWALALMLLTLPVVGFSLSPLARTSDPVLKDSDHKKLGAKIEEWIQAKREKDGISDAKEEVDKELGKWRKKASGQDPLALDADLGRALWHSFAYGNKGIVKGKVKDVEVKDSAIPLTYTILAPSRYSQKNSYPLVLIIPEFGKKPFDYLTEAWVLGDMRDNAILVGVHMPDNLDDWNVTKSSSGELGGVANILLTFKEVFSKYAIDFDKVFLAGRMQGLQAAMVTANQYPDRFAGVIGRTGDFSDVKSDNFQNIATFFAGGGEGVSSFKESSDAAGYANCTVAPTADEAAVWKWIQETRRNSNPTEITISPGTPFPRGAFWLSMPPWDGEGTARVHGKVNREENTITIEGHGVVSVSISFNDSLVDLSKPVKVICNGVESVDLIPRTSKTFLDYVYVSKNDPGKVYLATKQYGLSSGESDSDSEEDK